MRTRTIGLYEVFESQTRSDGGQFLVLSGLSSSFHTVSQLGNEGKAATGSSGEQTRLACWLRRPAATNFPLAIA